MCGGNLKSSIDHPTLANTKLYLLFDPTHNTKNIFNNWVSKKLFILPPGHISDNEVVADFNHIQQLFTLEETKPLKIAHKLNVTSTGPSRIQKQSIKHALSKFLVYWVLRLYRVLQTKYISLKHLAYRFSS